MATPASFWDRTQGFLPRRRARRFNSELAIKAVSVALRPERLLQIPERERPLVSEAVEAIKAGAAMIPLGGRGNRNPGVARMPTPVSVTELATRAAAALKPSSSAIPADIEIALRRQGIDWVEPFAPGRPLTPFYGYDRRPRQQNYSPGRNISTDTRPGRLPFALLKQINEEYDMASICIRHIINDTRSMKLKFGPMEDYEGGVAKEVVEAKRFLRRPDGKHFFVTWLAKWMIDVLRYDAGTLALERNAAGKLVRVVPVQGTTIAPILDYYGERPAPPAPAFQQFVQGIPWDWLSEDDVVYEPQWPLTEDPYGVAPIETCMLNANTDLRLQTFFLGFFTDGVVPEMMLEAPEGMTDPDAIAELQETWDDWYENNQTGRHGARWLPFGSKPHPYKPDTLDPVLAEHVMRRSVAAFGLVPQDLGFTETVNRATADTQVDTQFRITTLPNTEYYEAIIDYLLQDELQLPVAVHFDTGREKEDRLMEAQAQQIYVSIGAKSPDEVRTDILGLPVDNSNPVPRFFDSNRLGPIPVKFIQSVSGPIDPNTLSPSEVPEPQEYVPLEGVKENITPEGGPKPAADHVDPKTGKQNTHDTGNLHTGTRQSGTKPASSPAPARRTAIAKKATAGLTASTALAGQDLEGGAPTQVEGDEEEEYTGEFRKELLRWRQNTRSRLLKGQSPRYFESDILPPALRDTIWSVLALVREPERVDEIFTKALDATRSYKSHRVDLASGLALRALDTGRVLMIQRAWTEDDVNRGRWEFPGGHPHPHESPVQGAVREWQEETGMRLPVGTHLQSTWDATNGRYRGHVMTIPTEAEVPCDGRNEVSNPDGDSFEAIAWMDPDQLSNHPGLRPELAADIGQVLNALQSDATVPA